MKRNSRRIISSVSLKEVYHMRGEYSAKMLLDPTLSPQIDQVQVEIRNSDGVSMDYTARRWGTKLNVSFVIDENTPDGVSIIDARMTKKDGTVLRERLDFWVIKD